MTAARPSRANRRRDLRLHPFPKITIDGSGDPELVAERLREWAEQQATDAVEWYLRDKTMVRLSSRLLRLLTILLAAGGALIPLVNVASGREPGGWGYVLLAGAAACAALDHFFGISSAWMRDITTVQALQRRLTRFQLDWLSATLIAPVGDAAGPGPHGLPQRVEMVVVFVSDIADLMAAETEQWLAEFRSNVTDLYRRVGLSRPEEHPPVVGRPPAPIRRT